MDYYEYKALRHADDELMHRSHKYITRYKNSNGKWVYVYTQRQNGDALRLRAEAAATNMARDRNTDKKQAVTAKFDHTLEQRSVKTNLRRAVSKAKNWLKNIFTKKSKQSLISSMKSSSGVATRNTGRTYIRKHTNRILRK